MHFYFLGTSSIPEAPGAKRMCSIMCVHLLLRNSSQFKFMCNYLTKVKNKMSKIQFIILNTKVNGKKLIFVCGASNRSVANLNDNSLKLISVYSTKNTWIESCKHNTLRMVMRLVNKRHGRCSLSAATQYTVIGENEV